MKNLIIGTVLICAATGKYTFTEKHFEVCLALAIVGLFFGTVGTLQIISEFKKK
jgi:hypothetical protein